MDKDLTPNRRTSALWLAALALALLIGLVGWDRLRGGSPDTVASSALESMRAQNRLVPFVARYVSVVSSNDSRLGGLVSSQRTLILPGEVRYELDLSGLEVEDVRWDEAKRTLSVDLPEIEISGPEIDLAALREYGGDGLLGKITDANEALDERNRRRAIADLRQQAAGAVPMRLARHAAREAIERSFALPLRAAGYEDVRVVATFPTDGRPGDGEVLDQSRSVEEVLSERRAKETNSQ